MKNILFAIASILILFACTQKHETHDDDTSVKLLEDIIDTTATAPVQIIEPEEVDMGLRSVKAKFIDFELGDAEHYSFQDEQGNYWEFSGCDDTEIEFGIELDENEADERNQGWGANKALQGKWFRIKFEEREQPEYIDGPMVTVKVINKAVALHYK